MDQQTLRQWESRCIQEEPPFCQAACPLHMDGRAFCGFLAKGDMDGARKVLERSLPLPSVLGRLCEAPCRAACKRREAGEALELGLLERAVLALGRPGPRPMRLPRRPGEAVVLGHGLAALVCAWDLLKKGWGVLLRTGGRALGAELAALPAEALPPEALAGELATLTALGLSLDETPAEGRALLDEAVAAGRAVFLEWGFSPATDADFPAREAVDPVTLAGATPGLFFGGWPCAEGVSGRVRVIDAAADGRRAASSLDRQLSKASLTAAREKEGVQATRLFTSLAGVVPAPRVAPATADYDAAEAGREAARCLNCQCLECVRVCAYLEKHKAYPKSYVRQIYNNAAIVKGQHLANKLVDSCSLCGLCGRVCPEGFDMAELCRAARQDMVERDAMPQSAFEFGLEDMDAANGPDFELSRPDPATGTCGTLFFPGCQLCASHPHHVEAVYAHLRAHTPGGAGLMLRCCGVPADWAGEAERFRAAARDFAARWEALGRPRLVVACSSCLGVFRSPVYAQAAPGLVVTSLWEELAGLPLPEAEGFRPEGPLVLNDPCTARGDAPFREAFRALARRAGVETLEPSLTGELAECCGFGGIMGLVDAPLAATVAARRAASNPADFLASCAMCRDRLSGAGKRCLHLLDLFFPCPEADPAARSAPGWSDRQEGRAALKARLLRALWGEETVLHAPGPELRLGPELALRLEARRLLRSDLRQTLDLALAAGRVLEDADSGRLLLSHRPRRVTFWIEVEPEGTGWRLRNAWSHRMLVPGAGGLGEGENAAATQHNADRPYLPEAGRWRCQGCGQALEPRPVTASYLNSVFNVTLLRCPACGQTLVPEGLALGRMAEVEQLLEDK